MPLDQELDTSAPVKQEQEMSFLDHVDEMRGHIIRSLLSVIILAIVAFVSKSFLFDTIIFGPKNLDFWTYRQLCNLSFLIYDNDTLCLKDIGFTLKNINMSGQFTQHLFISFITGIIVAFPYILWEFWRFLKPALSKKEKRSARGIVFYGSSLFFLGVGFGYFILSPVSINFLGNYRVSEQVANEINLESYISFVATLTFATGIIFEMPLLTYFLTKLGLLGPNFLRKYRRYAFLVILILSAAITPPDVTSQILLTVPLYGLYEFSIFVSKRVSKS